MHTMLTEVDWVGKKNRIRKIGWTRENRNRGERKVSPPGLIENYLDSCNYEWDKENLIKSILSRGFSQI